MPQKTVVINVVGLNQSLLEHAPCLGKFAEGASVTRLQPVLPAVTCSVQSSMLTGAAPAEHGIVGNGWYHRELAEIHFWKQSNRQVHAEKVWETAKQRDASVTCANMFWWYNMYSSADYSVTPRPDYKADGRKMPDCYSDPPHLRTTLQEDLGQFPLFHFWGPGADITSSRWIADAAIRVDKWHDPTLTLIYLPHLDYGLQKLGPAHVDIPEHVRQIDEEVRRLIEHFEDRGASIIVLSEYGIEPVTDAVHVNRVLRAEKLIRVRVEQGGELLDPGGSDAFAVADHQLAHVYLSDPTDANLGRVRELLEATDGVERVMDKSQQEEAGLAHDRSGDLVLVAESGRWFSYYYWDDDAAAPDFARTVEIHRKPGYDPAELFIDPSLPSPKVSIGWRLLKKKLGFRTLMDLIPLDASLVRGSHGRVDLPQTLQPVLIQNVLDKGEQMPCTGVRDVILQHLFTNG